MSQMNLARARLRSLMEHYWLRPETAVWRTIDCLALDDVKFRAPILDIGCGDGVFSFIRAGGRLGLDFDAFSNVRALDRFFDGEDIYDQSSPDNMRPSLLAMPSYRIDVGLDHKTSLLQKASVLEFYDKLLEANADEGLPFPDESFQTIYSNILYWLDDVPSALREIRRTLAHGGIAVVQVPSDSFRDYSFYQRLFVQTGDPQWAWLRLLDRGRSENVKHCKSQEEWTRDFEAAGLRVVRSLRYLSRLVLEAWDIGLRPISPVMIAMANKLSLEDRRDMKAQWIENLMPLLEPLCTVSTEMDQKYPPGFWQFILQRS